MPLEIAVPALLGVALLGWCAGMMTFKRSLVWCKICGRVLACPHCHDSLRPQRSALSNVRSEERTA